MKALIVDDEQFCRENLKLLIQDFCPEINHIETASNAAEARKFLMENSTDVLFLDIKMPNETGFDLLKSLSDRPFSVVFTTAHNEYALNAIKEGAIDYLEKPINIDELREAVLKVESRRGNQANDEHIKNLVKQIYRSYEEQKIAVPMREGFELLNVKDIVHLEASESYTLIYLKEGKRLLSSKNIKVYEDMLDPDVFFRTHKSHIVNVKYHLTGFSRVDGNSAILSNGKQIPISRRKLQQFLDEIMGNAA